MSERNILSTNTFESLNGRSASCADPDEDDACDRTCGEIFEPFWDDCGEMLNRMRVDGTRGMSAFYDTCLSTLYPPGDGAAENTTISFASLAQAPLFCAHC
eukprot:SAG31_NODE_347_length_17310_cov_3.764743_11_plen_101_part_00